MALPSIAQLFPAGALAPAAAKTYWQSLLQSLLDNFGDMSSKAAAQKSFGVAVVDRAYAQSVGSNTYTAKIPIDNTVPQSNEGTQIFSLSLTPKSTTNRFRARVQIPCATSFSDAGSLDFAILALFINGATSASVATSKGLPVNGSVEHAVLEWEWIPGSLSPQTVTLRAGCANGNLILGGNRFGALLGGVTPATFVLEELTA